MSDDGDSFDLGENLLDMNEETMDLAMEEVEDTDTLKEASQKVEKELDIKEEEERDGHVKAAEDVSSVDNSFDLGENVLDMNEETMELAMEGEEETMSSEGLVDVREHPVQAKVNRNNFLSKDNKASSRRRNRQ